jgi:hypothetical protein
MENEVRDWVEKTTTNVGQRWSSLGNNVWKCKRRLIASRRMK